jgi:hypothetical protein
MTEYKCYIPVAEIDISSQLRSPLLEKLERQAFYDSITEKIMSLLPSSLIKLGKHRSNPVL